MKFRTSLFVVLTGMFVVCAVTAQERVRTPERTQEGERGPQVHNHYYGGGGYGYGSPYGGYGGYQAGVGQRELDRSQASENYAETAHMIQQNHNYAVNSYYANKDEHDQYVAQHKEPTLNREQRDDIAKKIEPGRLSSEQFDRSTKVINWPALLRDNAFNAERQALDHLFDERTPENSGQASDSYVQIKQACDAMQKTLGDKLRSDKLPSVTFICCEHFINSLSYEGSFAVK